MLAMPAVATDQPQVPGVPCRASRAAVLAGVLRAGAADAGDCGRAVRRRLSAAGLPCGVGRRMFIGHVRHPLPLWPRVVRSTTTTAAHKYHRVLSVNPLAVDWPLQRWRPHCAGSGTHYSRRTTSSSSSSGSTCSPPSRSSRTSTFSVNPSSASSPTSTPSSRFASRARCTTGRKLGSSSTTSVLTTTLGWRPTRRKSVCAETATALLLFLSPRSYCLRWHRCSTSLVFCLPAAARAGRAARVGTRAARLIRIVRVLRWVRDAAGRSCARGGDGRFGGGGEPSFVPSVARLGTLSA